MNVCVIDASVMIPVFVNQPFTPQARGLMAGLGDDPPMRMLAPDLLYVECANAFWRYVQHDGYDAAAVTVHLTRVRALALEITSTWELVQEALARAIAHGISAYDACYVALARREGCSLITGDRRLIRRLVGSPIAVQELETL
jgi:predicted nucleic acid-binding protein